MSPSEHLLFRDLLFYSDAIGCLMGKGRALIGGEVVRAHLHKLNHLLMQAAVLVLRNSHHPEMQSGRNAKRDANIIVFHVAPYVSLL